MARKNIGNKKQTFSITAPDATSVMLAGDFTQWQEQPISLKKGADGIWQAAVDLPLGKHHYRFIVDGQWCDDPECTVRALNPYGSENSVREVV